MKKMLYISLVILFVLSILFITTAPGLALAAISLIVIILFGLFMYWIDKRAKRMREEIKKHLK